MLTHKMQGNGIAPSDPTELDRIRKQSSITDHARENSSSQSSSSESIYKIPWLTRTMSGNGNGNFVRENCDMKRTKTLNNMKIIIHEK